MGIDPAYEYDRVIYLPLLFAPSIFTFGILGVTNNTLDLVQSTTPSSQRYPGGNISIVDRKKGSATWVGDIVGDTDGAMLNHRSINARFTSLLRLNSMLAVTLMKKCTLTINGNIILMRALILCNLQILI